MKFQGAFTALVTPFQNGEIDEERFRSLIERQINEGINGLVPCGTTGESATMSHQEHMQAIKVCVEQADGRVPVVAGAGSNNTREAVELTRFAKEAGADGALHITPYYNKPTQEGMVAHFTAIAQEVSLPLIIYNVPGRTGSNLLPETLARMSRDIPEVVGVKEASGNIRQISEVIEYCGQDFTVLAGDDFVVLPLLALGGKGVISVASNLVPAKMAELCSAFLANDLDRAQVIHYSLAPLCRAMFLETNPIPVKTAMALMGKLDLEFRLPLVPMQPDHKAELNRVLKDSGLI